MTVRITPKLERQLRTQTRSTLLAIGGNRTTRQPVIYAISFDPDTEMLEQNYPGSSWQNAYSDIDKFLRNKGFERHQGSVYFGDNTIDVVMCQLAVQKMTVAFPCFGPSLKDIRMLRIEDNDDLMPTVEMALQMKAR